MALCFYDFPFFRDIASRNCLAHNVGSRTIVKIADFGLSRMAPEHYELATKRRLPVFSMPPEALHAREWTKATDVWSFGILMLEVNIFSFLIFFGNFGFV